MQEIKTIGVIGHNGMVGSAVYAYFKKQSEFTTYGFSHSTRDEEEQTNNADCIFVCVPTPFDWNTNKFDGSIVDSVLSKIADEKLVVIKSTILFLVLINR